MTEKQVERLKQIAVELQWMARRYADGRMTSATLTCNECTRNLLAMGIKLKATFDDQMIWARDAQGRDFDGLTAEEATPGTPAAMGRGEV